MLGLNLNHVSKRGAWDQAPIDEIHGTSNKLELLDLKVRQHDISPSSANQPGSRGDIPYCAQKFNTNGLHFVDIFKCIFLTENFRISNKM